MNKISDNAKNMLKCFYLSDSIPESFLVGSLLDNEDKTWACVLCWDDYGRADGIVWFRKSLIIKIENDSEYLDKIKWLSEMDHCFGLHNSVAACFSPLKVIGAIKMAALNSTPAALKTKNGTTIGVIRRFEKNTVTVVSFPDSNEPLKNTTLLETGIKLSEIIRLSIGGIDECITVLYVKRRQEITKAKERSIKDPHKLR